MAIPVELLSDILERSLTELFIEQGARIATGVSERNTCARLGAILERNAHQVGLTGYFADPEDNRKQGGQIKTILDGQHREIKICADLILHSRGVSIAEDNLIAIEMKKARRPAKHKAADRDRLRAMTKTSYNDTWSNDGTTHPEHVCGYRIGALIILNIKTRIATIEYFREGLATTSVSKKF